MPRITPALCDALLFGAAAALNPITGAVTAPATAGLFGSAGAFGFGEALSTLGTLGGFLGSFQQSYGQSRAYDYNAQIAAQNAQLAQQQAAVNEQLSRQRSMRVLGQGRADVANSGVTLSGSSLDVLASSAADAELEALNIRYGGTVQSADATAQSSLERLAAQQRLNAAYIGAGTNLLTDAGRLDFGGAAGGAPSSVPIVFAGSGGIRPWYSQG